MKRQTSGSITFDTEALAAAAVDQLGEVLGRIETNLQTVASLATDSVALDRGRMTEVLHAHAGHVMEADDAAEIAETLSAAGYALVAVSGTALDAALAERGHKLEALLPADTTGDWLDRTEG